VTEEPRLKAKLWVQAAVRSCNSQGVFATIARSGDADAGAVLIKQNLMGEGFCVLTQIRTAEGNPAWLRGTGPSPVPEAQADAYIARQIDRDSDVWVIEIEERTGRLPFGGAVV
jgi:GMP synthase (glutamine-hydrolysing)